MPETRAEQMHFTKQNPGQCINLITEILHRLANNSRIRFQNQKQKTKRLNIHASRVALSLENYAQ